MAGEIYPHLSAHGKLELPRVLSGNEVFVTNGAGTQGGAQSRDSRDLTVLFAFNNVPLNPTVDPTEEVSITSEPPLSPEQIMQILLGGAVDVLTGSGDLAQFAEGELIGFGSSFISRAIEDEFNLAAFRLGGSGSTDNPFYMDLEKEVTPDLSVTYYRDFFSETSQFEEYGVRYKILESHHGNRYDGIELEMNFQDNAFSGVESEFMFTWTMRF